MEIDEFLEIVKREGPDVHIRKSPSANVIVNRPDIPVHSDPPKSEEYIDLKVYYDKDNNVYRYSEDNRTWTNLDESQLEDIFYRDIKPFIL